MSRTHLVVGAGPAGLVAAVTLARSGADVEVLEQHSRVGQRFHGDFQGLENWSSQRDVLSRLADLGVAADFACKPFREVTLYDSRLRAVSLCIEEPLFYLVRRGSDPDTLDSSLLRQARAAGAEVRLGQVARAAPGSSILATGPRGADGIVAGYTFGTRLRDQARCIVSSRLAPAGYAYLLVWEGRATLATCLLAEPARWRQALADTVTAFQQLVPGLDLSEARPFGGYGGLRFPSRYTDPAGRLYAGEAAGLQDPQWGFGMMHAMSSGALSARSLLDGTDYARNARRRFDPIRRAGLVNRSLFEALPQRVVDSLLLYEAPRLDVRSRLARHWAPNPVKSATAPLLALRSAGWGKEPTLGCGHATCTCVRCGCTSTSVTAGSRCDCVERAHAHTAT